MPSPEVDLSTLVILVSACVGLLTLMLLVILRISSRLARLEKLGLQVDKLSSSNETGPTSAETSAGGAFEIFLSEDPSRRQLPKGEQFSAYRQWRQEKGMNWSNS